MTDRRIPVPEPPAASAAYHEAGHAVVGLALGRPLARVSRCFREGDRHRDPSWGFTVWEHPQEPPATAEDSARTFFAGPAAEALGAPGAAPGGDSGDRRQAWFDAVDAEVPGMEIPGWLAQREAEARELVRANWPAIEAVAELLLERGEATGDEVRRLVERATHA